MLHWNSYGSATDRPPLLIAHGLFGSARNWNVIATRLSDTRQVVAVDMRNHGESFWSDDHSYEALAGDLAEVIGEIGGPADVLGHSMGGKAAMMLALTAPDTVRKLIVADIAPVTYGHSQMQYIEAMQAVDLSKATRRSDVREQLADLGVEPALQSFFTQSLDLGGKGWQMNLDALAAGMGPVVGFPEVEAAWDGPALFLSGALSDYVRPEHRPVIKRLFPNARFAKIPGTQHWLHAEKPRDFEAAVRVFLDS
ncbi:alpha/beta fold hydrolase [Chachezhania antarctica]|uniref:alpha/beta fold hydrolase n=1 Tax=Chachezhania antarctica TaxID=2340860 RepID=UPI000EABDCE9|nr:alpha/beta fold hydrolase [Chachezhania antarctica]